MDRDTGSAPVPDSNPLLHAYKEWQLKIPFVTRNTLLVIVFVYLLSWIVDLTFFLANVPAFVVFYFQIYRLILSPFVGNSIFSIIMIFFFFPQMGAHMERMIGSTAFLSLFVIFTLLTNVSYVILAFMFWLLGMQFVIFYPASGFWAIIFGLITIDCMKDPESVRRIMCLPIDITAKWFPLALYAFFFLLGGADFACLLSIGLGYAYGFGYLSPFLLTAEYVSLVLESGSSASRSGVTLGSTSSELGACFRQWGTYFSNWVERGLVAAVSHMSQYPGFILSSAVNADGLPQYNAGGAPPAGSSGGGAVSGMPDFGSWFNGGGGAGGGSNTVQEPPAPPAPGAGRASSSSSRGPGAADGRGRYSNVSTIDNFSIDSGDGGGVQPGASTGAGAGPATGTGTGRATGTGTGTGTEGKQQNSYFSGPGNKLSSGTSSGGGGSTAAGIDRDAARRKRLAALERSGSGFSGTASLPVATAVSEPRASPSSPTTGTNTSSSNQQQGSRLTAAAGCRPSSAPAIAMPQASAPLLPLVDGVHSVTPDPQSMQMLVEMGFEPPAVYNALMSTNNNLNEALAILTA